MNARFLDFKMQIKLRMIKIPYSKYLGEKNLIVM